MKKLPLTLVLLSLLALCACSAPSGTSSPSPSASPSPSPSAPANTSTAKTKPTPSPTPEPVDLSVGDSSVLGDWEITLDSFEVVKEIQGDYYGYFEADEGNHFVVITLTVKNTGTSADSFLDSYTFGNTDVRSKIFYQGTYEYTATSLLGYSEDLHDEFLNPLTTKTGIIAFSIVDEAALSNELTFVLTLGSDRVTYNLF